MLSTDLTLNCLRCCGEPQALGIVDEAAVPLINEAANAFHTGITNRRPIAEVLMNTKDFRRRSIITPV
ncbi:MAG: hypothetical protein WA571_13785 [Candidatus Binatus sp.]